jgi:ribonuclease BN (tRNA processing enzyme)
MTGEVPDRLRMTVLGCTTAIPHPASPAAGYLVEWGETALLLDVGQGVVRRLEGVLDPTTLSGVIVGHMHADHFLDLAGLRYLFPWGEPAAVRLPVHLPPGGRRRLDALATAISERPDFFDDAFTIAEYDPALPLDVGPLTVRFMRGRHYVPAWAMAIEAPDGSRLVYTGDSGPSDALTEFASGADLLLVEAALRLPTQDDAERGHLTAEEAIDLAVDAHARDVMLVHYPPVRFEELETLCQRRGSWIRPARLGLTVTVTPRSEPAMASAASSLPSPEFSAR